jgi:hypothetical protein
VLPKAVISKAVVGDLMALPSPCHCPPDSAHRRQRQTGRAARIAHHRHGRWDRRAGGAVLGAVMAGGGPWGMKARADGGGGHVASDLDWPLGAGGAGHLEAALGGDALQGHWAWAWEADFYMGMGGKKLQLWLFGYSHWQSTGHWIEYRSDRSNWQRDHGARGWGARASGLAARGPRTTDHRRPQTAEGRGPCRARTRTGMALWRVTDGEWRVCCCCCRGVFIGGRCCGWLVGRAMCTARAKSSKFQAPFCN